jgi:hypothetical protein
MIERTYKCDLCGSIHDRKDLVPVKWAYNSAKCREGLSRYGGIGSDQAEHHLCSRCIEDVAALAQEVPS